MPTIKVEDNGPYQLKGSIHLIDEKGNSFETDADISLCRCGHSDNKPFCDGSHKGHFEHEAVAFALPPKKPL